MTLPPLPGGCIGLFHCLDDDGRRRYAAAVHRATRPGATLLLSCFSDVNPVGGEPRPAVSEETLIRSGSPGRAGPRGRSGPPEARAR